MEKYQCFNCDGENRYTADHRAVIHCLDCGCKMIREPDASPAAEYLRPKRKTADSKIRHIKDILHQRTMEAHSKFKATGDDYDKGRREGYDLAVLLLQDLLDGFTYDPEGGNGNARNVTI